MASRGALAALVGTLAGVPIALAAQAQLTPDVLLQRADGLVRDGRFTDAADAYRNILGGTAGDGERERARAGLTLSLLRKGDFAGARAEGALLGGTPGASARSRSLYGDSLWSSGLFDEAERAYDASLTLDPDDPRAHHGRARALTARGRFDDALAEAQHAIAGAPDEAEFHHMLGVIYERLRRFPDAAAAFGEYIARLPDHDRTPTALWTRAEIRFLHAFDRLTPMELKGDAAARESWTVPIRIEKGKVLVRGRVNGDPVDFVLDTGAEQTVLSLDAAVRRGVNPVAYTESAGVGDRGRRGLQVGRIDRLQVGDLDVRNVPCLIKNPALGAMPTREPDSFSPLALGLSMTIDYARRELVMARALPASAHATELPLRVFRLATVRGLVNGTPVSFVVDTGGQWISISRATAEQMPVPSPLRHIPLKVYGTSGWDTDAFLMPNVDLAFDALHLAPTSVVVLNLAAPSELLGFQVGGIVGHSFLSKYRVTFDLQRSVLALDSNR
jgi:predicted aspartyl protease/Flp pilus assembly protein TadD